MSNSCNNSTGGESAVSGIDLLRIVAENGPEFKARIATLREAKKAHDEAYKRAFHDGQNERTNAIVAAKNMREEAEKFAAKTKADATALKAAAIKAAEELVAILKPVAGPLPWEKK